MTLFVRNTVICVLLLQDGRDGAVAAAESGRRGADCCGHGGHHEGLQGKLQILLSFNESRVVPVPMLVS